MEHDGILKFDSQPIPVRLLITLRKIVNTEFLFRPIPLFLLFVQNGGFWISGDNVVESNRIVSVDDGVFNVINIFS